MAIPKPIAAASERVLGHMEAGLCTREACRKEGLRVLDFVRYIQAYRMDLRQRATDAQRARWRAQVYARRHSPEGRARTNELARLAYALKHPACAPCRPYDLGGPLPQDPPGNKQCAVCGKMFFACYKREVCSVQCQDERRRRYRQSPEGRARVNANERARYAAARPGCKARVRRGAVLFDGDGAGV
jgi:hypothetical protein